MSRDTYFVCATHGDIFIHRNSANDYLRAEAVEPVRNDVTRPAPTDEIVCPLCGNQLTFDHRQASP